MKRLKIIAAVLLVLSLALLCAACGNKPVEPTDEDGNPDATQQEIIIDDKKPVDDPNATDDKNVTEEDGVIVDTLDDEELTDKSSEGDNAPAQSTPSDKKPGTSSGDSGNSGNSGTPDASKNLKWEEFYDLSPEAKDAYKNSFASKDAFFDWMIDAQDKFTEEHPNIEIGADGTIDLSKLK